MAVRKLKGSWWVDFSWEGARFRKRSPLNTREAARDFEATLRRELIDHGSLSHRERKPADPLSTFDAYVEHWLATYVRTNNRRSEQESKANVVRLHLGPFFENRPLAAITRRDIEAYKASRLERGLSPKSINNHLAVLGRCLRMAYEDELIPNVPVIKFLRVPPQRFDFLLPEESLQLLSDRTEPFWTDLARLALRTGLRRGELMALDWSAVDLANAKVTVRASLVREVIDAPKNNRIRHVPLTADVVAMLAASRRRAGLVFTRNGTAPLTEGLMSAGLQRLRRRTGLRRFGWHVLRHTFASHLAMEGVPIAVIKELMGHGTLQMTMRYAHLAPSTLAEAVPALLRAEARARDALRQPAVNQTFTELFQVSQASAQEPVFSAETT